MPGRRTSLQLPSEWTRLWRCTRSVFLRNIPSSLRESVNLTGQAISLSTPQATRALLQEFKRRASLSSELTLLKLSKACSRNSPTMFCSTSLKIASTSPQLLKTHKDSKLSKSSWKAWLSELRSFKTPKLLWSQPSQLWCNKSLKKVQTRANGFSKERNRKSCTSPLSWDTCAKISVWAPSLEFSCWSEAAPFRKK